MKTFEEQQEARIKILKAEFHHRKLMLNYEKSNYQNFGTEESLKRFNEVKQDFNVVTIQLAEAERALNYYKRYSMWETAEFKKEYTG